MKAAGMPSASPTDVQVELKENRQSLREAQQECAELRTNARSLKTQVDRLEVENEKLTKCDPGPAFVAGKS